MVPGVGELKAKRASGSGETICGQIVPDAAIPRPNRTLIYSGACMIAGIRLGIAERSLVHFQKAFALEQKLSDSVRSFKGNSGV
jgi:hypothetical protein